MNVKDLYFDVLCENEDKDIIDKIVLAIKKDGFDISQFSLVSVECYTWEFISRKNIGRGFQLFYDPNMVNEPISQYQLINGSVAYSFNARNITEAYIQHNRRISNEDYHLLSKQYSKAEIEYHKKAQKLAKEYGATIICKIYNCKEGWLNI